jgi:hypothetical protein
MKVKVGDNVTTQTKVWGGGKTNLTKEENGDFHSTLICNGTICFK